MGLVTKVLRQFLGKGSYGDNNLWYYTAYQERCEGEEKEEGSLWSLLLSLLQKMLWLQQRTRFVGLAESDRMTTQEASKSQMLTGYIRYENKEEKDNDQK